MQTYNYKTLTKKHVLHNIMFSVKRTKLIYGFGTFFLVKMVLAHFLLQIFAKHLVI